VEAKTRSKIKPKFKPLITCFSAIAGAAAVVQWGVSRQLNSSSTALANAA